MISSIWSRRRLSSWRQVAFLPILVSASFLLHSTQAWRHHSLVSQPAPTSTGLKYYYLTWRGGSAAPNRSNDSTIELNPDYQNYVPPPTVSRIPPPRNEHEVWLQKQQQPQPQAQYRQSSAFTSFGVSKEPSILDRIQQYFLSLHHYNPSLFWTTLACIGVFGMWQSPLSSNRRSPLYKVFVNSHINAIQTFGASLILSSFSHISPSHLLLNLMTLSQLGPSVRQLLQRSQRWRLPNSSDWKSAMWPLLFSSAAFSNTLFLLGKPRGASSLGLSGVTMALLSIQARAYPDRQYGIIVGVIPISLRAKHLLQWLLLASFVGSWPSLSPWRRAGRNSNIAHLAHLGGLLYGLVYYEIVILGRTPRQVVQQLSSSLRRN